MGNPLARDERGLRQQRRAHDRGLAHGGRRDARGRRCHDVETHDKGWAPGLDIHEMGGARMGKDPRASILNEWNQVHGCPNVFVTDGACMTSTGNQSPSILYMALTARAVNHAVDELKRRNL